jgi:hypothetical protein
MTERPNPVSCLSVTLRRGRTGARVRLRYPAVLGAAALAATVVLGGCSAAAAPAKASADAEHSLTLAQAQAAYDSYVTASTAAAKQGNATQGLAMVADAQWSILHAQYTAHTLVGTPVTQYSYGTPAFYVPAQSGYPQWFMVEVPARTDTDGHLGAAVDTIMVFVRSGPSQAFTLDGSAVLDQPLPAIARDSAGYAISTTDQSLLLPPDIVGPTQAAVVDEGPTAPAASVVAAGTQTTALYAAQAAQGHTLTAQGLNYQWLMEGASFAQYDLRTTDGGALVIYAMYLNTVTEHPGNVPGSPVAVPANFAPLVPAPDRIGTRGVNANWTYEFAAVDPPQSASGAKIQVIAGSGAPTYGHGY